MLGTKLVTYFMRDIVYVKRVTDRVAETGNAMCLSSPVGTTRIVTNRTYPGDTAAPRAKHVADIIIPDANLDIDPVCIFLKHIERFKI